MRIWLVCFGLLFAIAELYQWMRHLTLPLPICILGGAFLAIASNYNKRAGLPLRNSSTEPPPVMPSIAPPNPPQPTQAPQSPKSISLQ